MAKESLRIAYAQTNPVFGEVASNVKEALRMIRGVEADIVVLPELFNTGYAFASRDEAKRLAEEVPGGATTQTLLEESKRQGKTIVAGLVEKKGNSVYNTSILVSKGSFIGSYRKLHLFNKEKLWFNECGVEPQVYDVDGVMIGMLICFDWLFPEVWRVLALKGADVVAHPSNLVLPYCQRSLLTRAFENHIFIVTANRVGEEKRGGSYYRYTGRSQIVSPKMDILASAPEDTVECRAVQIDLKLARNKKITELNDLLADRRPRFYTLLAKHSSLRRYRSYS